MQVKEATIKTIKDNKSRANHRAKAKRKNPLVEHIVLLSVRQCTADAVSICAQRWEDWKRKAWLPHLLQSLVRFFCLFVFPAAWQHVAADA